MLTKNEIEKMLFPLNDEEKQLRNRAASADIKELKVTTDDKKVFLFDESLFIQKEKLSILPHTRYSEVPMHVHSYIELIYVYKGECKQIIKGEDVALLEGEFCLLDKRVPHKVLETNENDIIINILLRENYFSYSFIDKLKKKSVITQFLSNIIYQHTNRDSYIVFHSAKNPNLKQIMLSVLGEYYDKDEYAEIIIDHYMTILFTELLRVYDYEWHQNSINTQSHLVMEVLSYMIKDTRGCNLADIAKKLGYNSSYLSTLIKRKTSYTFSELLKKQRIRLAYELLIKTELSLDSILDEVGYTNKTFFYAAFKNEYGCKPSEIRKNNHGDADEFWRDDLGGEGRDSS
ncbi:AraC family transcriptional regulator [Alkalicoccobacillus plakortidis]|uniref:AraC family transcriptional regulator n=1 Tax=Alkalicoccobacillus plakortidis TaxID=444060 RepID=A0ABT0XK42_9BACI|nr:AraC family transcriptional regulator [Alkalicoccobacillus plakortidis]MCM2676268.1 AraC family transcriptional regulator [Alkalicoccobacillus plakortidis]